ncbi:MAG TPA: OsmC family protein [Gaiellaceae bacterium]|nr:OsmC family protein [Gaiellaceae bacterium]
MGTRAKEFRYAVDLGEGDSVRTEDGTPLGPGAEWTPEHLLLAGLLRCSLKSLRHHAQRDRIEVQHAAGSARALVTKRESDGRYAVVETEVALDVTLEPKPGEAELADLLTKAERDCFVGASLTIKPTYRWSTS